MTLKYRSKDHDSLLSCNHMPKIPSSSTWNLPKFMILITLLVSLPYLFYSLRSSFCPPSVSSIDHHQQQQHSYNSYLPKPSTESSTKTTLKHVVFGIAASAKLWEKRKRYIKLWWIPGEMNGVVWLDKPVKNDPSNDHLLPPRKISNDTSRFKYKNPKGHRSAIRISRIVSETLRIVKEDRIRNDVRWFVMGDDDTFFLPDNLIRVLSKYDHNQFYYIGSSSESHLQNIYFSYNMAYGGGGFAISYPLAKALEKMQDRCIERYPGLYGSDDRIQACMAELGVPLTKEPGFHQYDVYGSLFGLLAAHPVAPLVSLHHLDVVDPIFPDMGRVQALQMLRLSMKLDSAGILQQSICYDRAHNWTVSVSWGYAVQILRGIISAREMEKPARTFLNWYRRGDYTGYPFNTRPLARSPCQKPFVYYLSNVLQNPSINETASEYVRHRVENPDCSWKIPDPSTIDRVEVFKKSDPYMWDKAPRRNCCRILPRKTEGTMEIDVGVCADDEVVEIR